MNAQVAMNNHKRCGENIQKLVQKNIAGQITDAKLDALVDHWCDKAAYWWVVAQICGRVEVLADIEAQEQKREQAKAKFEYRQWIVDNDLSPVIPTYWHGRAMASRPGLPTYHSRLGRVTIPEND